MELPQSGKLLISVRDADKGKIQDIIKKARDLGFQLVGTIGTAHALGNNVKIDIVNKVSESSPNIKDAILNREIDLIINTPSGKQSADYNYLTRRMAVDLGIPYVTTLAGARAALNAIENIEKGKIDVKSLNEYHNSLE
jgi:carbamoyl-phosphate synthase large subunit